MDRLNRQTLVAHCWMVAEEAGRGRGPLLPKWLSTALGHAAQDQPIEHPNPILRAFHAVPRPGTADELARRLCTESVDLAWAQPGLLACLAAGSVHGRDDLVFLTAWRDEHAARAFAGPDLSSAVLPDGYQHLLARHAVTHRPLLALHTTPPG